MPMNPPSSLPTHLAASTHAALASSVQNAVPATPTVVMPPDPSVEEEEPYTIKCVCEFTDDDGNTIYCENCDTWQHIQCYYPETRLAALSEDFDHSCVECRPRYVDRDGAAMRQRQRLETVTALEDAVSDLVQQTPDKKSKRPPAKSHKKRAKQAPVVDGPSTLSRHVPASENIAAAAPPTSRKAKPAHRASNSVGSHAPLKRRSPSYGNARSAHPPSPAATPPEYTIFTPSQSLIEAYDGSRSFIHTTSNSYASLTVSSRMAAWPRDPEQMKQDAACLPKDVFRPPPPPDYPLPSLAVVDDPINVAGRTICLKCLTASEPIAKDSALVELQGFIAFQKDYCLLNGDRWDVHPFPPPFVFFHDTLPLCIDTRQEGSQARWARRSCRPTARLETFLEPNNHALYHFMLFADHDIDSGERITLPWDFRPPKATQYSWRRLLGLDVGDEDASDTFEPQPEHVTALLEFVPVLLGEYGGCACGMGSQCAFERFLQACNPIPPVFSSRIVSQRAPRLPRPRQRQQRPKPLPASPSRAATHSPATTNRSSESHHGENSENEQTPGLARVVHQSETLSYPAMLVSPWIVDDDKQRCSIELGAEPTEREKRKAAALEENIRRAETQKPKRKKARLSNEGKTGIHAPPAPPKQAKRNPHKGAARLNTPAATVIPKTPLAASNAQGYHSTIAGNAPGPDCSSTCSPVESHKSTPASLPDAVGTIAQIPRRLSTSARPKYFDQGTQTGPHAEFWWLSKPCGPTRFPTTQQVMWKRFLANIAKIKQEEEQTKHTNNPVQDELVQAQSQTNEPPNTEQDQAEGGEAEHPDENHVDEAQDKAEIAKEPCATEQLEQGEPLEEMQKQKQKQLVRLENLEKDRVEQIPEQLEVGQAQHVEQQQQGPKDESTTAEENGRHVELARDDRDSDQHEQQRQSLPRNPSRSRTPEAAPRSPSQSHKDSEIKDRPPCSGAVKTLAITIVDDATSCRGLDSSITATPASAITNSLPLAIPFPADGGSTNSATIASPPVDMGGNPPRKKLSLSDYYRRKKSNMGLPPGPASPADSKLASLTENRPALPP